MTKESKNPLSSFEHWSVTGWSATFQLITLNVMNFVIPSGKTDEGAYRRSMWGFVRPSHVKFHNFIANTKAIITKVYVSSAKKGLSTYRLEFKGDSFIEIVAQDCRTIQW